MTDAVAPAPTPTLALTPENFRALLKKPLLALPPAVRPAGLRLWACYRHLPEMQSPLSLAALVAVWVADWGLSEAGAAAVLHALTAPDRVAEVRFASDLTAALAAAAKAEIAAERVRERRRAEEADRREHPERYRVPRPPTEEEWAAFRAMRGGLFA